jgi:hypothetical protein
MAAATQGDSRQPWYRRPFAFVLAGFLGVAAFFLVAEHRAHALGALPYLLLLACPLMHLFMHHGHGVHGHDAARRDGRAR